MIAHPIAVLAALIINAIISAITTGVLAILSLIAVVGTGLALFYMAITDDLDDDGNGE